MEDLSHMIPSSTGLTGGESMNGANMISDRPASLMSAPGSTPLLPDPPMGGPDNPELDIPAVKDYAPRVNSHGKKAGD